MPRAQLTHSSETDIKNPLEMHLGYQLRRASAFMMADLGNCLSDLALRPTEASILLLISANSNITQSEIGRVLGIQRANMAPFAASLVERGFIDKSRADGRSQGLRLTDTGTAIVHDLQLRTAEHEARFLSGLTHREREKLVSLLSSIWTL